MQPHAQVIYCVFGAAKILINKGFANAIVRKSILERGCQREGWKRLAHSEARARTMSEQPDPKGHAQKLLEERPH